MNKKEIKNRIEKLKQTINYHRYLYHVLDREEISEAALDSLKHELYILEQDNPEFITLDSPTRRVEGKPLEQFEKVVHKVRMLSLNDMFSFTELAEWEKRIKKIAPEIKSGYFTEIKMDGLAVSLIYINGILTKAATRGDGKIGEDVTLNIRTIEGIPLNLYIDKLDERQKLLVAGEVEIRGEVYMNRLEFERVNKRQLQKGEPVFANPRNLAAGSIRQLDSKITATRKLDFMGYNLVTDLGQTTHEEAHDLLIKLGIPSNKYNKYCSNLKEVQSYFEEIRKKRERLPYQIDGVVVSLNEIKYYEKLGVVGKAPRYMVAYKFPAEQSTTKLLDIEVQVGRTGALTPVAILEPVNLAGTVVSRATLHNYDEILRKDIKIGDTVIVQKAGDVIPEVLQSLPALRTGDEKEFAMPECCPICASRVSREKGGKIWRCENKNCYAQVKRNISHFVSKAALNIDGMGHKIVEQLINKGLVNDVADIYSLTKGDLEPLERFAEKSADNLIEAIEKSKTTSLDKLIYALGIRHVGTQTAFDLAKRYGKLENLERASYDDLSQIEGVGEVVAVSIGEYFRDEKNQKLIQRLFDHGVKYTSIESSGILDGKVVVVTGSLENYSRESIGELIKKNGGRVSGSISKNVDLVLVGNDPGSKAEKAMELNLKIITEKDLEKMLKFEIKS